MSYLQPSLALAEPAEIETERRPATARLSWSQPILVAAWFGLLAGILEGGIANFLRGVPGFAVRVSPEILWIAPAFNLILFLLLGFGLATLFRLRNKGPSVSLTAGLFTWVTLFGLLLLLGLLNQLASLVLSLGLGVQVARMLRTREVRALSFFQRSVSILITGAVLIGTIGAFWDYGRERYQIGKLPPAKSGSPNVILITLDTLRADHVSAYGYGRSTTPNLDRLAKSGVLFENAFSNSSWTLPSHASLFTGRLPDEHKADWAEPLNENFPTLGEVLAAQGYLTGAFSANTAYVTPEWGLARGFSHFGAHGSSLVSDITSTVYGKKLALNVLPRLGYFDIPGRKRAQVVNQELIDWLNKTNGRPFFAFLNYFDLHDPYLAPDSYGKRFSENATRGDLINFRFQSRTVRRKPSLTQEEIQSEIDGYDGCLAYLDAQLGDLFSELARRGLDRNTLLIITSDHGEAFGNHDLFGHGNSLYVESLHVPLIAIWPDKIPSGTRVSQVVSLNDVPTTIMRLLDERGSSFPGIPLSRYWSENPDNQKIEPIVATLSPGRFKGGLPDYPVSKGGLKSLVTEQWHFILSESGRAELYAWREDPNEARNLADDPAGRIVAEELKQRLNSLVLPGGK